ncbi:MAG: AMP-binding protein [Vulcanimicrobiaceae bacterium]
MKKVSRPFEESEALPGSMMDVPLTVRWIYEHVARNHARRELVSRNEDGTLFRCTYGDFVKRVAQLAGVLVSFGVRPGDRVASFAWNTHRHLELYYAVPMLGAVLHTTNIRLFPEQVEWVLRHAEDRFAFVDASLEPALARALQLSSDPPRTVMLDERYDALLHDILLA